MFFICTAITTFGILATILLFPEEKPVFQREVNNKMYGVGPYFLGKLLAELPSSIFSPLIFNLIVYNYVGLSHVFWWTWPLHCKTYPFKISRPNHIPTLLDSASLHNYYLSHFQRQKDSGLTDPNVVATVYASFRILWAECALVLRTCLRHVFLPLRISSHVPQRVQRPAPRMHGDQTNKVRVLQPSR
jgi:hypothetical protein